MASGRRTGRRGGAGRWQLILAAAVAAAAAILLLLRGAGESARAPLVIASIEVEGSGSVLANGTSRLLWNLTEPFALALEAEPERCWVFRGWLVNGSPFSGEPSVTLAIGGNTTVRAVFAARPCALFAVSGRGLLLVNGSPAPEVLELDEPSTLILEARPERGFTAGVYVNGTPAAKAEAWTSLEAAVRVGGVTNVTVEFLETYYWIRVDPNGVEASVNGTLIAEPLDLRLPAGYTLEIAGFCKPLNETHQTCPLGWRVSQKLGLKQLNYTAPYTNLTVTAVCDTLLAANPGVTWKAPPPAKGGVIYNGTEAPSIAIHTMFLIFPPSGSYRYLGDGWWEIEGGPTGVGVYISVPGNWSKLRIEGTWELPYPGAVPALYIDVVVEHSEYNYECGVCLSTGPITPSGKQTSGSFYVVFPREILDLPNYPEYYQDPPTAYKRYAWPKVEGKPLAFCAAATRSKRIAQQPGVKAGDIFIYANEVKARIRVVAEP